MYSLLFFWNSRRDKHCNYRSSKDAQALPALPRLAGGAAQHSPPGLAGCTQQAQLLELTSQKAAAISKTLLTLES